MRGRIPLSGLASRPACEARSNGVQSKRVCARVIGVDHGVVVEAVEFDDGVVTCRLRKGVPRCCGPCWRRCGGHDQGRGDAGGGRWMPDTMRILVEAGAQCVSCPTMV